MILIMFAGTVALIGALIFGSFGLAKLVRWIGWPQDVLAFAAMGFVLLAGVSLSAWRLWDIIFKG